MSVYMDLKKTWLNFGAVWHIYVKRPVSANLALAEDIGTAMGCFVEAHWSLTLHGSPFYCETGSIPMSTVILVQEKSIPIATSSQKSDAPRLPGGAFNRTHTCYTHRSCGEDHKILQKSALLNVQRADLH